MHKATRPALRRFLIIDRELRKGSYPTAATLARLAEVDVKTIRRDIQFLQDEYHAPISFDRSRNGWAYSCPTYRLPAVLITEGELVAVFLAGQALPQIRGTSYEHDLRRALDKLNELLPDEISVRWDAIEQAHSFRQSVCTLHDVDIFRQLADAVLHRRQLHIRYWTASREEETERVIDPWHLTCLDGGEWYLIAWCHRRQARRMFAPARIREISETGETFSVPEHFRLDEFLDGTFKVVADSSRPLQTIRLRFAPSAAKYIREKIWHPSQQLHLQADGSAILQLELRNLIEVRRWIMSWGAECQVLEPAELRSQIRDEARAMLKSAANMQQTKRVPSRKSASRGKRKRTA